MGCDYYILKVLHIYYNENDYLEFELDRERCYYFYSCDSDEEDYEDEEDDKKKPSEEDSESIKKPEKIVFDGTGDAIRWPDLPLPKNAMSYRILRQHEKTGSRHLTV